MLIVTADHGEELFEDGRCGHGGSLRDSLVRVPLLVHDPARFPGGTIVDEGAEGVDLLPTILDALGDAGVRRAQGSSLAPLAQGIGARLAAAVVRVDVRVRARDADRPLEDARRQDAACRSSTISSTDPGEMTGPVAAARPVERRMLTDDLGLFLALRTQWKKRAWGVVTNMTAARRRRARRGHDAVRRVAAR